ncbi:TetR/AcrR family transcriptional regulator [Actinomadura xylanilytica]|uniref:TetR/AcrR family transcriptional regulator n=1 Tax=Actinomadura xylanilytica TaxID=887459 RepID=UPI00255A8D06|nr:TetR/AcrR family transcriptional regulator [Actinomadura xylanilytica]MDL4775605.1 helix-turn-helix domain-containing protein [Actinomadura xylanilytica]
MVLDLLRKALEGEPPTGDGPGGHDETARRILDAALAQFQDFGLRRSTVEDVARRGGLSRITIYRRFPKKEHLVAAVLLRELRRFQAEQDAAIAARADVEDQIVESVSFSLSWLRGHVLLNRLLQTEPEAIVPYLTVQGGPVVEAARDHGAALIRRAMFGDAEITPEAARDIAMIAELGARVTLSFVLTRQSVVPLETLEDARRYAREYVVPMYRGLARKHGVRLPRPEHG